jgi:hypothetical protein
MLHNWVLRNALLRATFTHQTVLPIEDVMPTKENGQIVESPTEARQAERGPSVAALLAISTVAAIFTLAIIWFVFFRT